MSTITVSSGQTVSGATIMAADSAIVLNGGTIEDSTLYGSLTISAGGLASNVTASGGQIQNGGTTIGTVLGFVTSGGFLRVQQYDLSGSVASDTLILNNASENVSAHAVSFDATLRGIGSFQYVVGTAQGAVISAGGAQEVSFGVASNTTVLSGGVQLGFIQATVVDTMVENGGLLIGAPVVKGVTVLSGGEAVEGGGVSPQDSPYSLTGVIEAGGTLAVFAALSGGADKLSGTTIAAGGTLVLVDGAAESGAVLQAGAVVVSAAVIVQSSVNVQVGEPLYRLVSAAATTLSGVQVGAGMYETVYGGGTALATAVSGGQLYIDSGGVALGTMISAIGTVGVSGIDSQAIVGSGGIEYVFSGGASIAATVQAGGRQLDENGLIQSALVLPGGFQQIEAGTASATRVASGGLQVLSGYGTAAGTVVGRGGVQEVFEGTASGTVVQAGGQLLMAQDYGTVSGGVIASGGAIVLDPINNGSPDAAVFHGTEVQSGAAVIVLGQATETGLVFDQGAAMISAKVAIFSGLGSVAGDTRLVAYGNVLSGGTVGTFAQETVYAGGVASATLVSGAQLVESGGHTVGVRLHAAATAMSSAVQYIDVGGTATGTIVYAGGHQSIYEGFAADTVLSGGVQVVTSGTVSGTVVNAGSVDDVEAKARSVGATVFKGGNQIVYRGATSGTSLQGGKETINTGGIASGTVISAGGDLVINAGSAVNTVILQGGTIDLARFAFASGGAATLNASDVLTVSEGGRTYQLQLAGTYSGEAFNLASDAASGTLITLSAAANATETAVQGQELLTGGTAPTGTAPASDTPSIAETGWTGPQTASEPKTPSFPHLGVHVL